MLRVINDDIINHRSILPSRGFPEYDAQSIGHALSRIMKNSWFGKNYTTDSIRFWTFCVVEKYDDVLTSDNLMELK